MHAHTRLENIYDHAGNRNHGNQKINKDSLPGSSAGMCNAVEVTVCRLWLAVAMGTSSWMRETLLSDVASSCFLPLVLARKHFFHTLCGREAQVCLLLS